MILTKQSLKQSTCFQVLPQESKTCSLDRILELPSRPNDSPIISLLESVVTIISFRTAVEYLLNFPATEEQFIFIEIALLKCSVLALCFSWFFN